MRLKALSLATLAVLSTSTSVIAKSVDWNLFEAGYASAEIEDMNADYSGFTMGGSVLMGDSVFISGKYQAVTGEFIGADVDLTQTSLGLGYRFAVTESSDMYTAVTYEGVKLTASNAFFNADEDDSGMGFELGVRSRLSDILELSGSVGTVNIFDEYESTVGIGLNIYLSDHFAIGAEYSSFADLDVFSASLRYAF